MTLFNEFLIIFARDINKDVAGKYTVKVSNHSGSTEESFMIYISGLPGAPIGPLEMSEIASYTCKLYWSSQEFDAGSKITYYLVERRTSDTMNGLSLPACALYLHDDSAFPLPSDVISTAK